MSRRNSGNFQWLCKSQRVHYPLETHQRLLVCCGWARESDTTIDGFYHIRYFYNVCDWTHFFYCVAVQWFSFVRCVECLIITRVQSQVNQCLQNILATVECSLINEYLSMADFVDVAVTCIKLFEPLFIAKEAQFPCYLWPKCSLLLRDKPYIWGQEFKTAVAEHHSNCNALLDSFIASNVHLVD